MEFNYKKETIFILYSFHPVHFYELYDLLKKQGLSASKLFADDEYVENIEQKIEAGVEDVIIRFDTGASMHFIKSTHLSKDIFCVSFYFEYTNEYKSLLEKYATATNDIYYAYLTNYHDVKWQNEKSLLSYKANNKSIKDLQFCLDIFEEKVVDISQHYGRSIYKDGILFVAAYCSFFGDIRQDYFKDFHISRTFLTEIVNPKTIRVQLFEDINSEYSSLRKIQKSFLEDLGLLNQ